MNDSFIHDKQNISFILSYQQKNKFWPGRDCGADGIEWPFSPAELFAVHTVLFCEINHGVYCVRFSLVHTRVKGRYILSEIKEDPSDDMFLACAMEAKADFIVSRDPHLRNLKQFHGVKIIDVKGFKEKVRKK